MMEEGDEEDAEGEEEEVGRKEGNTVGTHIFLGITEGLAGEVLLHHVLIETCHHDDDENTAEELFPEMMRGLPVVKDEDAAHLTVLHDIDGFSDRQVHHGDDLEDDEDQGGEKTEGLEGVREHQCTDAATTGIEPYEEYHAHDIDEEGDAHGVENKLLENHTDDIELHGRARHLREEEKPCSGLIGPPTKALTEIGIDTGQ